MKAARLLAILFAVISLCIPACDKEAGAEHEGHPKVIVTSPAKQDVVYSEPYVCQIHARRFIKVRALVEGYLQEIHVKEGQFVKKGELMFRILPVVYKAKLNAALAEAKLAEIELSNTRKLFKKGVVSAQEVKLYEAKLAKAKAEVELTKAEFQFTEIKAPFAGLVDRIHEFQGALVEKKDELTTLFDNSVMWVYFNVPEARYLEYMAVKKRPDESQKIELVLANGRKFPYTATNLRIEAGFNNETGNVPFRADFPNPEGLLRHGQTGKVLLTRTLHNAIVIPQRATFNILEKRFVYVVDEKNTVHQREITVQHELDDIFIVKSGLRADEKIILDGIFQVNDGVEVEYEYEPPEKALAHLQFHAE